MITAKKDTKVPQHREGGTQVREQWDDAVADVLGMDRSRIAHLADLLARDPYAAGEVLD